MDQEACHAAVHEVAQNQTQLSDWTVLSYTQACPNLFLPFGNCCKLFSVHCSWAFLKKRKSESRSVVSESLQQPIEFSRLENEWITFPFSSGSSQPGSNPGLLHFRWILYLLIHKGSPRILEWVAYPFSRDLADPGLELGSPALQADSLPAQLPGKPNFPC